MRKFLLALAVVCIAVVSTPSTAFADENVNEGVCEGTHIAPPTKTTKSITITAPEGKLISGYCVKAGSIKQGDGPEYVVLDPAVKSITITHTSGKDISHYTLTFVTAPPPPHDECPDMTGNQSEGTDCTPDVPEKPEPELIPPLVVHPQTDTPPTPAKLTELPRTGAGELLALTAIGISLVGLGTLTLRAAKSRGA